MENRSSNLTETVKGMSGDMELCERASTDSHQGALWIWAVGTLVVRWKSCAPVPRHSTWDWLPSDSEAVVPCPALLTSLPAMQNCCFLLICCHVLAYKWLTSKVNYCLFWSEVAGKACFLWKASSVYFSWKNNIYVIPWKCMAISAPALQGFPSAMGSPKQCIIRANLFPCYFPLQRWQFGTEGAGFENLVL